MADSAVAAPAATPLGIAMVGHAFMGAAHSQAWRTAPRVFPLTRGVRMQVLSGRSPAAAAEAATRYGWAEVTTRWQDLLTRPDVDVIDICTPGDSHAEIAVAALQAGKHVLCEKPLATTLAEAEAMAAVAERAAARGVVAMCGFTYRRVPAVRLAADLVAAGTLGTLRHIRATYLQDWLVDPAAPMSWRLEKERAGSGALGDIGAHIVDMAAYVTGDPLVGVAAVGETFVRRRPRAERSGPPRGDADAAEEFGEVTVDDASAFLGRTASGALATFEASRVATGHRNGLRLELNGSSGSLVFDLQRLNELQVYDATQPHPGFRTVLVTEPDDPYLQAWWPPGHVLGWEHSFTHQVRDLVEAIATGAQPRPSFAEALQVQRVLDAVERSARDGSGWEPVTGPPAQSQRRTRPV